MNEKIKKYIANHLINHENWQNKDIIENNIIEYLIESDPIYEENVCSSRWWMNTFRVVKIGELLIGFDWAITTGDENARDKGWEFDPKSICEVEKKEEIKVVIKYIKKES